MPSCLFYRALCCLCCLSSEVCDIRWQSKYCCIWLCAVSIVRQLFFSADDNDDNNNVKLKTRYGSIDGLDAILFVYILCIFVCRTYLSKWCSHLPTPFSSFPFLRMYHGGDVIHQVLYYEFVWHPSMFPILRTIRFWNGTGHFFSSVFCCCWVNLTLVWYEKVLVLFGQNFCCWIYNLLFVGVLAGVLVCVCLFLLVKSSEVDINRCETVSLIGIDKTMILNFDFLGDGNFSLGHVRSFAFGQYRIL